MDPFSITVGTFTLIGAVNATAKAIGKLVHLRDVPLELLQLSNEVQDLEATIAKTDLILEMLEREAASRPFITTLTRLKERAIAPVQKLQALLQDHIISNYDDVDFTNPSTVDFSKRSWLKKQKDVKKLRDEIKVVRSQISEELVTASSWSLIAFRSELRRVRVLATEVNLQVNHEVQNGTEGVASDPPPTLLSSEAAAGENTETQILNTTAEVGQQSRSPSWASSSGSSTAFEVNTATYVTRPCQSRLCTCKCHRVSQAQPLAWVSGLFGSLFVGYSGVSLPFTGKVACTERLCQKAEKGILKASYYFPNWTPFSGRMVSILDSWNSLDGHQLHVKFPRVIPASAGLFTLVQKGNIEGVQRLFSERKASVFDVNASEGRSALHFALTANQPAMAKFLITQKADVHLEDKYSLSAVDTVWNYILGDPHQPAYLALREAFGGMLDETEDLQKRNFSTIHLIVFGISRLSLDEFLQSSSADIDSRCALGRTPLSWAAQIPAGYHDTQILVGHGAAVHLPDSRGQTPLHLAAETGHHRSLQILLEAASRQRGEHHPEPEVRRQIMAMSFDQDDEEEEGEQEQEAKHDDYVSNITPFCREYLEKADYKGRTAIHFAVRTNNAAHARLLLRYGADVNRPDLFHRAPLHIAMYWDHVAIVRVLLQYGARLDVVDDARMTVLHYAARYSSLATLKLLAAEDLGCVSPHCRDSMGYTPLEAFLSVRSSVTNETEDERSVARETFDGILLAGSGTEPFGRGAESLKEEEVGAANKAK